MYEVIFLGTRIIYRCIYLPIFIWVLYFTDATFSELYFRCDNLHRKLSNAFTQLTQRLREKEKLQKHLKQSEVTLLQSHELSYLFIPSFHSPSPSILFTSHFLC